MLRFCFAVTISISFSLYHASHGLVVNSVTVPVLPTESQHLISSEQGSTIHARQKLYDSVGSHHRWTGVLLLSLLQSPSESIDAPQTNPFLSAVSSTSITTSQNDDNKFRGRSLEVDKVERILDANTIQLKKKGVVKLAGVRMPSVGSGGTNSNFQFPTCFAYSPSYKIRQLLPKKTSVRFQTVPGGSTNANTIPQVVLIRNDDSLVINEELVKTGFAIVKNGFPQQQASLSPSAKAIIDAESLAGWQESARSNGLGIFRTCNSEDGDGTVATESFVAEFEPLERSMETVFFSDGGKPMLRDETTKVVYSKENPPKNPILEVDPRRRPKGCSDFETYEDALQFYEKYLPYYGDVAKLDRNGDGVPCPGTPHTTDRQRYRMKVPTASIGMK